MITDRPQTRELPFWPTLLCLWAAGWVTSAFTTLLFVGRVYPTGSSPALLVAVNLLLSSAIGAVVVKQLLLSLVECEISYGAVLVALVAGSTVSTAVRLGTLSSRPTAGLGLSFLPAAAGALVSFWLLQNAARSEHPAAPALAPAEPAALPAGSYDELVAAVRESALSVVATVGSAPPASVPTVIADGLLGIEVARNRLEHAELPSSVTAELNQRLVRGLRQLADDLVDISEEAATAGNRYVTLRLDQSEGLRAVRQALDDLEALRFGTTRW